jgi:hypothetical protein
MRQRPHKGRRMRNCEHTGCCHDKCDKRCRRSETCKRDRSPTGVLVQTDDNVRPRPSVLGRPISLAVAGCQPFSPNPRYLRIVRALCKGDHKQKGVFQWVRSVSYMKVQMWRRGIPAKA